MRRVCCVLLCAAAASGFLSAACGRAPTSPAPTAATTAPPAAAPTVSSVSPATLVASAAVQIITVTGNNFQSGLTLTMSAAGGVTVSSSGQQISNVTATSFQAAVTIASAGSYTVQVTVPGIAPSNGFGVTVQAAPAIVTAVSPASLTASAAAQSITVTGSHFESGLTVELTLGSDTVTVSGAQIANVTPTSFQASVVVATAGSYAIRVTVPGAQPSNAIDVIVQAPMQGPISTDPYIARVSPSVIEPSTGSQTITVIGANFQSGIQLAITRMSNGVTGLVGGLSITNVTPTSFDARVVLGSEGDYRLQARYFEGASSNSVDVKVVKPVPGPPAADPIIAFVSSDPALGTQLVATAPNLKLAFSVQLASALPEAYFKIDLLDDSGLVCASGSKSENLPAGNVTLTLTMLFDNKPCPKPATIVSAQATLRAPDYADLTHTKVYAAQSFPVSYPLRQYPVIPPGPPTPPTISRLSWQSNVIGCGSCLLPGETANVSCTVKAADGTPMTTTITIAWDGGSSYTSSQAFPLGASAATNGATFTFGKVAPNPPKATATCAVVNARGETATASIRIPF
jgi:IPT/TIG domain